LFDHDRNGSHGSLLLTSTRARSSLLFDPSIRSPRAKLLLFLIRACSIELLETLLTATTNMFVLDCVLLTTFKKLITTELFQRLTAAGPRYALI
jgi:hypothetical protein